MMDLEIIKKIEKSTPIQEFKFGHTPIQIEYFQVSNQQGQETWEYWQHLLQIKNLHGTLCELQISYDEILYDIEDAKAYWPLWSRKKRLRMLPRLQHKLNNLKKAIDEKSREAEIHLEVIDKKYSHLKNLTEDDILKNESEYWAQRLSRQLGASHLSRILGVSESELLAVLALPSEQQRQIFDGMKKILGSAMPLLPQEKER